MTKANALLPAGPTTSNPPPSTKGPIAQPASSSQTALPIRATVVKPPTSTSVSSDPGNHQPANPPGPGVSSGAGSNSGSSADPSSDGNTGNGLASSQPNPKPAGPESLPEKSFVVSNPGSAQGDPGRTRLSSTNALSSTVNPVGGSQGNLGGLNDVLQGNSGSLPQLLSGSPAGAHISSQNCKIAGNTPPSIITAASQAFTPIRSDAAVISGSTLSPGGLGMTISGTLVFMETAGLVVGNSTIQLVNAELPVLTTLGQSFTAVSSSAVAVSGTTISAGGPGITISVTPVSVGASGLVVGSKILPAPTPPSSVVTALGQSFTSIGSNAVAIAGTTLSVGAQGTTISGTRVSVGPSGLTIGSQTIPLTNSPSSVITTLGQSITAIGSNALAVAGTTLSAGGSGMTISGIPVSMDSAGLVVGMSTVPISLGAGGVLGGPIISAFNPQASATITGVLAFQGGGSRLSGRGWTAYAGLTLFGLRFWLWLQNRKG